MPDAIAIRAATPDDAPLLLRLVRDLSVYERLEHEVTGTAADLAAHLGATPPACEALIALDGSEPVGFALHHGTYSTFLCRPGIHLEDLYVVPDARGRGVGRRLLAGVAALAAARGCGRLEWDVLDWNEPAIAFYRSLGAAPVEGWTRYRVTADGFDAVARRGG